MSHRLVENLSKTSDKGMISKTYRELLKFSAIRKQATQLKMARRSEQIPPKEDKQMANKYMKRCSASCHISELQIKTIIKYHYAPIRMAKIQNTDNT